MKKQIVFVLLTITLLFACKSKGPTGSLLSATDFSEKIKATPNAAIIDVRTPEEFLNGHIQNAQNIDWNGDAFDQQTEAIDKSTPLMVYCMSGGRSASAADALRKKGFKEVYELDGGIMKWHSANLPETTSEAVVKAGMSMEQFQQLTTSDKPVLVDFYADWCAPCNKMKPFLEEIAKEMGDKVTIIRINVEENPEVADALKVDALPTLQVYKNKTLAWAHTGFLEKEKIAEQLQ